MFVYPASDLDNPAALSSLLGEFWASTYAGSELVSQVLYARGQLTAQTFQRLNEVANATSQVTICPFRLQHWTYYAPLLSQLNGVQVALPQYGQGSAYQSAGGLYYGVPVGNGEYALPLPENLADVRLICDRLTQPAVILVKDIDFRIDSENSVLYFRENPFANPLFGRQQWIANGTVTDETLQLWLFRGQFDYQDLYQQFGYVIGVQAASSENYKRLINAVFAALIEGGSRQRLEEALSAVTGVPVVREVQETVELITSDAEWQYVITDLHVYTFQLTAVVSVTVGQTVYQGDSLVTALQFYEFQHGQLPDDLTAVAVGRGFLAGGYYGDLVFQNQEVPLVVTTEEGYTKVSFEIGGFPGDVEAFWNQLHQNGIAKGQTLAMLLDLRTNPSGQPTAASLPATINPLGFLIANGLRDNIGLVRIDASQTMSGTLNLGMLSRILRKLVAPHTALLVLVELSGSEEPVILTAAPTELAPGYLESGSTYSAPDPVTETVDPDSLITEGGRTWQASGACL